MKRFSINRKNGIIDFFLKVITIIISLVDAVFEKDLVC